MQISKNIRSSNFAVSEKKRNIEYVILHYTDQDFETSVDSLCSKEKGVSAHYLISEDREVLNLIDDEHIAWHAGTGNSWWHGRDYINTFSIGIEIVNLGHGAFTAVQMKSVIELCHHLKEKYNIPRENFIGHSDIAPHRKLDPGLFFDWRKLSEEGIGIEVPILRHPQGSEADRRDLTTAHEPLELAPHHQSQGPKARDKSLPQDDVSIPKLQTRLSQIGYKIELTGKLDKQTSDVIRAFKAHFCPEIILESHGIEGYRNYNSIYEWDEKAEKILKYLVR